MPRTAPNLETEADGSVVLEGTTWTVDFQQITSNAVEVDAEHTMIKLANDLGVDDRHNALAWAFAWIGCNHEATREEIENSPPSLAKP